MSIRLPESLVPGSGAPPGQPSMLNERKDGGAPARASPPLTVTLKTALGLPLSLGQFRLQRSHDGTRDPVRLS